MLHEPGAPYELAEKALADEETLVYEVPAKTPLRQRLMRVAKTRSWVVPVIVFVVSALILSLTSWERVTRPSEDPHFAYLANTYNSMLAAPFSEEAAKRREGKAPFELDRDPPHRNDWASYRVITLKNGEEFRGNWADTQGRGRFRLLGGKGMVSLERKDIDHSKSSQRYYMSFPPGPSFLMMPLAAIFGYEINDVIFTIFFAALNIMLVFLLLRRLSLGGRTGRSRSDNLWLTLLFGFGTVHYWSAVLGQVWFTALIMGITFTLLYMIFSIDARRPLLAGVCFAFAFATRTPLLFTMVFFFAFVFFPGGSFVRRESWGKAAKKIALFCAPCLVMGLGLMWMNYIRFESFSEFGHRYLAGGGLGRIQQYGLFNYHFLSKNLTAMFTLLPQLQPSAPYIIISKHGMSLLLTTPAFLYLLWPRERISRPDKFWFAVLWIAVAAAAVPGLFYQNTGYEQFGFRFSLDYTPYLIMLLAVGRRSITWVFKVLILAGVAVNLFGAITFKRFGKFYSNDFFV